MDFYFEEVFSNMNRDCLNEKFKRKELCEYFSTVIAGCAKGDNSVYLKGPGELSDTNIPDNN